MKTREDSLYLFIFWRKDMDMSCEIQIIKDGDRPVFAVIPYERWLELTGEEVDTVHIPYEVTSLRLKTGISLIAAWRKHLKVTQRELAEQMGMTQSAIAQIEKEGTKNRRQTLEKVAKALGLDIRQLSRGA